MERVKVLEPSASAEIVGTARAADGHDATLFLEGAHCSIWWRHVPPMAGERLGVIGHYACADGAHAGELLNAACDRLRAEGCTMAVGPMDGNTWRKYRFVVEQGSEPPFFLEPENPPDHPAQWLAAGFAPLAHYYSSLVTDLTKEDARVPAVRARLLGNGITIRPLRLEQYDDELNRIFDLSISAFEHNYLYTPLPREAFLGAYQSLKPHVVPDLVLLADHGGDLAAFVFAFPDLSQARRGARVDTVILKTLAARPGRTSAGIGAVLVQEIHHAARRLGFARVVHALMHEQNNSLNISGRFGEPFRRYALFSRTLR